MKITGPQTAASNQENQAKFRLGPAKAQKVSQWLLIMCDSSFQDCSISTRGTAVLH